MIRLEFEYRQIIYIFLIYIYSQRVAKDEKTKGIRLYKRAQNSNILFKRNPLFLGQSSEIICENSSTYRKASLVRAASVLLTACEGGWEITRRPVFLQQKKWKIIIIECIPIFGYLQSYPIVRWWSYEPLNSKPIRNSSFQPLPLGFSKRDAKNSPTS